MSYNSQIIIIKKYHILPYNLLPYIYFQFQFCKNIDTALGANIFLHTVLIFKVWNFKRNMLNARIYSCGVKI